MKRATLSLLVIAFLAGVAPCAYSTTNESVGTLEVSVSATINQLSTTGVANFEGNSLTMGTWSLSGTNYAAIEMNYLPASGGTNATFTLLATSPTTLWNWQYLNLSGSAINVMQIDATNRLILFGTNGSQGIILDPNKGITLSGTVSAGAFAGNLPASQLSGTLPAISGANLTNLSASNLIGALPTISGSNLTNLSVSHISGLAAVATSGSYGALIGLPTIPTNDSQLANGAGYITSTGTAAFALSSGNALSLSGTIPAAQVSGLASVATSGSFGSLSGRPTTLAGYGITDPVVLSGGTATNLTLAGNSAVLGDLALGGTNGTIMTGTNGLKVSGTVTANAFVGSGAQLTNVPAAAISGTLSASQISGTLPATVSVSAASITSGTLGAINGSSLTNLSAAQISGLAAVATSGSYGALIGLPTIPTNDSQLANGAGYITSNGTAAFALFSGNALSLSGTIPAAQVSGLASIATSGSFSSLSGLPTTLAGYGITDPVVLSGGTAANLTLAGNSAVLGALTTTGTTTIGGALNVSGTSTLAGSLIVTGSAVTTGSGTTVVAIPNQLVLIPQQGDLLMGEFTGGPAPTTNAQ